MNTRLLLAGGVVAGAILIGKGPALAEESRAAALNPVVRAALPAAVEVLDVTTKKIGNRTITAIKHQDAAGLVSETIVDASGHVVPADLASVAPRPSLSKALQDAVGATADPSKPVRVWIALKLVQPMDTSDRESGGLDISAGPAGDRSALLTREERVVSQAEVAANVEARARRITTARQAYVQRARQAINQLARRHGLTAQPGLKRALANGDSWLVADLTPAQIMRLVETSGDLVAGVDLFEEMTNAVASAMLSTRVNPYALNYSGRRGEAIGIYMTDNGCPDPTHITNYRRLAGSRSAHSDNVSAIARAVSPLSYIYCRQGFTLPTSADLNGISPGPRVHIITMSGGNNSVTDDYTTADQAFDDYIYNNAIATFTAAGNEGNISGRYVRSPSKGLNVVGVGNYNDANDTIAEDSSWGNPETKNEKPEISFPGVNITAGGYTLSGTSMATPHAAGFAADLMSAYGNLRLRPHFTKALVLSGATKSIAGAADEVGVGGGDFYSAYYNIFGRYFDGNNGSFSYFDSTDQWPNNGYVEREVDLNASITKVRAVLVWLNRGSYTYAHRADLHPIGMDLDLRVLDPNGTQIATASSFDNPYEVVNFDPQITGKYRFQIKRFANRDTRSNIRMALVVNW